MDISINDASMKEGLLPILFSFLMKKSKDFLNNKKNEIFKL